LEYKGEQIAGVVEVPRLGDSYRALRGDGAFCNGKPIHVSTVDTLAKSHVYYSSLSWFVKAGLEHRFLNLIARTERQRGFGDFYGFILVAQGAGELMLEWGTHPWDLSALTAIICEAGGKVTTWDGTPTIYRPDVIASNGKMHDAALALLRPMLDEIKRE
jgi:histidinol-phosphatase